MKGRLVIRYKVYPFSPSHFFFMYLQRCLLIKKNLLTAPKGVSDIRTVALVAPKARALAATPIYLTKFFIPFNGIHLPTILLAQVPLSRFYLRKVVNKRYFSTKRDPEIAQITKAVDSILASLPLRNPYKFYRAIFRKIFHIFFKCNRVGEDLCFTLLQVLGHTAATPRDIYLLLQNSMMEGSNHNDGPHSGTIIFNIIHSMLQSPSVDHTTHCISLVCKSLEKEEYRKTTNIIIPLTCREPLLTKATFIEDKALWHQFNNGEFSTKEGWAFIEISKVFYRNSEFQFRALFQKIFFSFHKRKSCAHISYDIDNYFGYTVDPAKLHHLLKRVLEQKVDGQPMSLIFMEIHQSLNFEDYESTYAKIGELNASFNKYLRTNGKYPKHPKAELIYSYYP